MHERRGITIDTALRLARYFKNTPVFWMNLQVRYDLEVAEDMQAAQVARDVRPSEAVTALMRLMGSAFGRDALASCSAPRPHLFHFIGNPFAPPFALRVRFSIAPVQLPR